MTPLERVRAARLEVLVLATRKPISFAERNRRGVALAAELAALEAELLSEEKAVVVRRDQPSTVENPSSHATLAAPQQSPRPDVAALRYAAKWHCNAEKMQDQGELAEALNHAADALEKMSNEQSPRD